MTHSADAGTVTVYRFFRNERGRRIEPQQMWGTLEAIKTLPDCEPIRESARAVPASSLANGFIFGETDSVSIRIDETDRRLMQYER